MIGYKGFDEHLRCRGMQYEIGKEYKKENESKKLSVCSDTGFHFCKEIRQVNEYYKLSSNSKNRFCLVEAIGEINEDTNKCSTDHIKILREIKGKELDELVGRVNGNTGIFNSGDGNTGDWNSGYRNSGYRNTGDGNSGDGNTGDWNSGYRNTGNWNTGNWNSGNWNSGYWNSGDGNSGDGNTGDWNSGDGNSGDGNTGDGNTGDGNTGIFNSGNRNSGDWNATNNESGVFNTRESMIRMFDNSSEWTLEMWKKSKACKIMRTMPQSRKVVEWIWLDDMSEDEKNENKECEVVGGYLKEYEQEADAQSWWNELQDDEKKEILSLPNFDAEIFKKITAIDLGKE